MKTTTRQLLWLPIALLLLGLSQLKAETHSKNAPLRQVEETVTVEVSYPYDSSGTTTIFDKTLNQELVLTENKAQVIKGHQIVVNATGKEGRTFYSGQWWPTGKSERNPINALPLELTADVNLSVNLTFQYLASYSVRGEAGGTLKGYFLGIPDPETWFPEEVPFDSPKRFFLEDNDTFIFKAEPNDGFKLKAWYLNGELVQGESELTYKVVQPRTSIDVEVEFSKEVAEAKVTMVQPEATQGAMTAHYTDDAEKAVTDGMSVEKGVKVTFVVAPKEGYEMASWKVNDETKELESADPNQLTLTVEGDLEVEPVLKSTAAPVEKVRLSVQEEGVGGFAMVKYQTPGSTTWERPAEGTNPTLDLPIGTKVRVEATISIGGATVAFTHNGNPVAADQLTDEGLTYEFTLEAAADIKVIFTEGVIGFQIFYDCDKHATITGTADGEPFTSGAKLPLGARVELTVTPEDGYEVKDWVDADFVLIEGTEYQNPYTFTVDGSVSVFAEIQKKTTALVKISYEGPAGYLETKYVEPNGSGNPQSIFGDKRIPLGSVVTVKAKFFMTGDYLVAYTNNGNPVPAEALTEDGFVYTFIANEDADVHAVFSEKPAPAVDYTITFEAGEGGTVTATVDMEPIESGAKIPAGTKIKILATPDEDYEIDEWLVDGEPVANTGLNFYYLSLSKDTNVKVTFRSTKPVEYVVTVDPVLPSAEAGTVQLFKKNGDAVESGKSVVTGTEMYVEVKPADKYELESLQVNNKTLKVGDENLVNLPDGGYKYLFTVTEATTIKATFKLGGAVEQLTASPIVAYVTNGGTRLEITGAAEGTEVRLYDYTGQLLLSSTEHALDISALPAGSYIVLVGNYTTRIVK
ncbi:InlB B-repeat-containing protein [Porphyromonas sp.]|uniref:InlB B-repeat-containing protein n=2 Tax=Porphyromonas TaxID=836 RepID=UPI003A8FAD56